MYLLSLRANAPFGPSFEGQKPPLEAFQLTKTIQWQAKQHVDPEFLDNLKDEWNHMPLDPTSQDPPTKPSWMTLEPQPTLFDWKDLINATYLKDKHDYQHFESVLRLMGVA